MQTFNYKQSKIKMSNLSNEQLIDKAFYDMDPLPLVMEAIKRGHKTLLEDLASINNVVKHTGCVNALLNFIKYAALSRMNTAIDIMDILLNNPEDYFQNSKQLLKNCAVSDKMIATILISQGTPYSVVHELISNNELFNPNKTIYISNQFNNSPVTNGQNRILPEIINLLKSGKIWSNQASMDFLVGRLARNASDNFITEVASFRLIPSVFERLMHASVTKEISIINKKLAKNLSNNPYPESVIASLSYDSKMEGITLERLAKTIIEIFKIPEYKTYISEIFEVFKRKCMDAFNNLFELLTMNIDGINPVMIMANSSDQLLIEIAKLMGEMPPNMLMEKAFEKTEKIINMLMEVDPSLCLSLFSEQIFSKIRMIPSHRHLANRYFYPHKQNVPNTSREEDIPSVEEHLNYLIGGNMYNWYKMAKINAINKEAGIKDFAVMMGLAALLSGASLSEAASQNGITPEQLEQAKKDPSKIEQAKDIMNSSTNQTNKQTSMDAILHSVLRHEGLLPKQTPFRITNPAMRKWKTIHGFPIDHNPNAPANRKNFIYLQRAEDVFPAVKKQFERYRDNPARYGLPSNPTLGDALGVFDQSGVAGKKAFLQKEIPQINFDKPLASYF